MIIRRFALLIAAPLLLVGPSSARQVREQVVHKTGKPDWEATLKLPRFAHPSAVEKLAERIFERDARARLRYFIKEASDPENLHNPTDPHFKLQTDVKITYHSKTLVSGYTDFEDFLGGAHGSTHFQTLTAGQRNGRPAVLGKRDIFKAKTSMRRLCAREVMPRIRENTEPLVTAVPARDYGSLVITHSGIQWVFQPYDVASYGDGPQIIDVPWKALMKDLNLNGAIKEAIGVSHVRRSRKHYSDSLLSTRTYRIGSR